MSTYPRDPCTTMSLPENAGLLERETGIRPPETSDRDGDPAAVRQRDRGKPAQWGCTSCRYYDPECTYCTYISTPVSILFVCPQALDNRR